MRKKEEREKERKIPKEDSESSASTSLFLAPVSTGGSVYLIINVHIATIEKANKVPTIIINEYHSINEKKREKKKR